MTHRMPLGLGLSIGLLLVGCTRLDLVPRAEMQPGRLYNRSLVYLEGGTRYELRRVSFRPDTLVGEYRVTVERESDRPGTAYEEETRTIAFPLELVDSVAVIRRDPMKTVFYGAGLAAAGYIIFELIDSDQLGRSSRDDGKPGNDGPGAR
jgi:hypothetical protein